MDENFPRVCFDRPLPWDLSRPHADVLPAVPGNGVARAAFQIAKLWPNGTVLYCRFLGGSAAQRQFVRDTAIEWNRHMGLSLVFDDARSAQIRISFDPGGGSWSYIGTDCLDIAPSQPTMNFGWQDAGTVLHEFGHCLGMVHEHQNPRENPIQWNRAEVTRSLSGSPNFWSLATIEHNMFAKYEVGQINGSAFDPRSIMLYSFPANWTTNGFHSETNNVLSAQDKAFIARIYPPNTPTAPPPSLVDLPVFDGPIPMAADIGALGEEDQFSFTVHNAGRHVIETSGQTDVVMSLFDVNGAKLAADDDSGLGSNAKIIQTLIPGVYRLSVRHYGNGTGKYGVQVVREKA